MSDSPTELLLAGILAALAVFIIWESFSSRRVSRDEMAKGFRPGWTATRTGLLVLAGVMAVFGMEEWNRPSQPPFQGYGAIAISFLYAAFGPRGAPVAFWILAAALILFVPVRWHKK
jgi:hypothetical protein